MSLERQEELFRKESWVEVGGRVTTVTDRGNRCPRALSLEGARHALKSTRQPVWLELRSKMAQASSLEQ